MAITIHTPNVLSALERACSAAGGGTALAAKLTERRATRGLKAVSKASVSRWKHDGVPTEVCPDIEAITGVRCEEFHPDVDWGVLRGSAEQNVSLTLSADRSGTSQSVALEPPA